MPVLICSHCGYVNRMKTGGFCLETQHCRACEETGLEPAVYDYRTGSYRRRQPGDPPVDLTEIEIDGTPIRLSEVIVLQKAIDFCRANSGHWMAGHEVFNEATAAARLERAILSRLASNGALTTAGLECVWGGKNDVLIRWADPAATRATNP